MPRISVILPIKNGAAHLKEAIESIQSQTYEDWELLAINEYNSIDNSAEIIREYAVRDDRIKPIQNSERLGLAESLNFGIRESIGEYIARMDADDISMPERFRKQVDFLESNPDVGICGTWQIHEGKYRKWTHRPPSEPKLLAAAMLFSCELCHSTVMMRKSVLIENDLFYRGYFLAEDFELWTRAICATKIANIPEELGRYRHGDKSITKEKMDALEAEHGKLCAAAMKRVLDLEIPENSYYLLNSWTNIFKHENNKNKRKEMLNCYALILKQVWKANLDTHFFDERSLLEILRARWLWACWDLRDTSEKPKNIEDVFAPAQTPVIKRIFQIFE